jgi:multidrug resistance protein MdtO
MATQTLQLPHRQKFSDWFPEFLRQELAPYPGRGAVVARMVIAATLSMILIVTFRIPGGAIGALVAFILSRENLVSTAKSALFLVLAFAIGGLFIPLGARMFASIPITHFIWEAVSLFLAFFLLRTLTNFVLATGLSLVATNVLAIWYLPGPAEQNVELTLWQVLAALIGALVTFAVEAVFRALSTRDEIKDGIGDRLKAVEGLLLSYAEAQPAAPENSRALMQYAIVGMGGLRRYVARANFDALRRMQMSTLVSLTGRGVDFSAALVSGYPPPQAPLQARAAQLASRVAEIRHALATKNLPPAWEPSGEKDPNTPLFNELESIIALMPAVFASEASVDPRFEILESAPSSSRIFVEDAFTNPEHLRFVLSGTLAAMLCYIIYVSLDWRGISTAVTTCVLTALSNVGASRQKQVLRVAGAILGGFVFGLGSQIFILPHIDSITGFAVLFAVVSAIAAWVSTSSARLSYAGLQIVVAYYLINLSEFSIQLSLTVARDRAIGVLLGVSMMWLVFERFYPKPASDQMIRIFIRNVRLMATLVSESRIGADKETIVQIRRQRDQIYRYFGEVSSQADAVPFETGPERAGHMAARDRIRRWQTTLRTFYLMEIPLLQFRLFGDRTHMSPAFQDVEHRFLEDCSNSLNHIASELEKQIDNKPYDISLYPSLQKQLGAAEAVEQSPLLPQEQALLRLTMTISALLDRFQEDFAAAPIFATK